MVNGCEDAIAETKWERLIPPLAKGSFEIKIRDRKPICRVAVMTIGPGVSRRARGSAFIEFVLLFPILFFLFIGAFDAGFFCYTLISVQSAARVAALYTSGSSATSASSSGACTYVRGELQTMPNTSLLPAGCGASPLTVTAQSVTGPDGQPASMVTVTYQTMQLIPIPGLPGQLSVTRVAEMRVRS
jgi:Flp pilus assembly protein TadG